MNEKKALWRWCSDQTCHNPVLIPEGRSSGVCQVCHKRSRRTQRWIFGHGVAICPRKGKMRNQVDGHLFCTDVDCPLRQDCPVLKEMGILK